MSVANTNTAQFKTNAPLAKLASYINNLQTVKIEMSDSEKFKAYYLKGTLKGLDEHMNLIIENTYKVSKSNDKDEEELGKVLLKGDNILLIKNI